MWYYLLRTYTSCTVPTPATFNPPPLMKEPPRWLTHLVRNFIEWLMIGKAEPKQSGPQVHAPGLLSRSKKFYVASVK